MLDYPEVDQWSARQGRDGRWLRNVRGHAGKGHRHDLGDPTGRAARRCEGGSLGIRCWKGDGSCREEMEQARWGTVRIQAGGWGSVEVRMRRDSRRLVLTPLYVVGPAAAKVAAGVTAVAADAGGGAGTSSVQPG